MNRIWCLVLGSSLLFLTSCFDMLEEVYLEKNGSGKYMVTMDMSGIMTDPFMKEALGEAMKSEGDKIGMNFMEMDSSFNFAQSADAINLKAAEKKLLEQVVIDMKSSEKEKVMKMVMTVNFSSFDQLEEIGKIMKEVGENQGDGAGQMFGGGQFSDFSNLFTMKKKKLLSRLPTPPMEGLIDEETKGMMSMLLAGSSYKTIYHLPGKVKKSTIPNAEIEGKTVTVEHPMMDIIDQKVKVDGDIKFK